MRTIGELRGRVGRVPEGEGWDRGRKRACGPGRFSQAPNLARLRSCLRAPQRRHAPAALGRRLDQWGRLPHRQRRRFLTPPGYGSARRRRRPCSRPRRRCGTGGPRWWRVPTPSCSGVGKVGPEFEVPEVLGDRPAVLCCAARISANSTWTEGKSGARRSASAHCCPARRYWPCMAASMAGGQCKFWLGRIVGRAGFQFGLSLTPSARGKQGGCQVAPRDRHAGFELESRAERCDCAVLLVLQHQRACQEQVTSNKYCPPIFIQRAAECQYLTHGLVYQRFICRILRKKLDPYTGKVVALSTKLYIL